MSAKQPLGGTGEPRPLITKSKLRNLLRELLIPTRGGSTKLAGALGISKSAVSQMLSGALEPTPAMAAWAGYELAGWRPTRDEEFECAYCGRGRDKIPARDRFYQQRRRLHHCLDCMFILADGTRRGVLFAKREEGKK